MGSVGYALSNTFVSRPIDAMASQHRIGGQRPRFGLGALHRANHLLAERNQQLAEQQLPQEEESHSQQASSSSSSQSSGSSSQASSTPASNGTASSSAPVNNGNSSAASSSGAASSQAPATFDPNSLGASGAANIPQWKAINADVRGWIKVPNTNISYPVVIGPDNNYYSNLGYYKEQSRDGCHLGGFRHQVRQKGGYQPQHRAVRPQLDQYFGQPPHRKCQ